MAFVYRSAMVQAVREYGHLEHLTHVTDAEIARRMDRSYRRLRALLDRARGHEVEKKEAVCHVRPGQRLLVLPADFYQLRGVLVQRAASEQLFV